MNKFYTFSVSRVKILVAVTFSILVLCSTAFGVNLLNTPSSGFLLCINDITKIASYPSTQTCPPGSSGLILSGQGVSGVSNPSENKSSFNSQTTTPTSSSLKVYDQNNNLVGYPIGVGQATDNSQVIGLVQQFNNVNLWLPGIKNFMNFYLDGKVVQNSFYFTTSNCAGTPYGFIAGPSDASGYRVGSYSITGSNNWYLPGTQINSGTLTFLSEGGESNCISKNLTITLNPSAAVETWIPASNPLSKINIVGSLHFTAN